VRQQAVSQITTLVEAIGARPLFIGAEEHDSFVAAVSHLPFLMSVALVGCTSKSANWDDIAQLASTGYGDLSRLASGDPVMHRDICISNAAPIVAWIDAFIRELYRVRNLLAPDRDRGEAVPDGDAVKEVFQQAFDARARWLAGLVNPQARMGNPNTEIPSFAESMGEMFAGRKLMQMQKRFFGDLRDGGPKKK
jgi:prephenate dehydrogenase